jgi:hypothetical protein
MRVVSSMLYFPSDISRTHQASDSVQNESFLCGLDFSYRNLTFFDFSVLTQTSITVVYDLTDDPIHTRQQFDARMP